VKLTTKRLRNMIKEELEQVVAGDDVVPGGHQYEEDPPHGSVGARWSGTPEEGIIELEDGTTITVYGGTNTASLEKVAAGLAAMGVESIADTANGGAPEKVLDFLKTKHQGGTITEIP